MDRKAMLVNFIQVEILHGRNAKVEDVEDLLSAGLLDSLSILKLVAFIEESFGIQVPDEDLVYDNFKSVSAMVEYYNRVVSRVTHLIHEQRLLTHNGSNFWQALRTVSL